MTIEDRLSALENKIDACLILLGKLTTADNFTYNLMDKSPLWMRAMSAAERLASRVSIDVAKAHPKCAQEEMEDLLTSLHPLDPSLRARETAARGRDQMGGGLALHAASKSSPSGCSHAQRILGPYTHHEPKKESA